MNNILKDFCESFNVKVSCTYVAGEWKYYWFNKEYTPVNGTEHFSEGVKETKTTVGYDSIKKGADLVNINLNSHSNIFGFLPLECEKFDSYIYGSDNLDEKKKAKKPKKEK